MTDEFKEMAFELVALNLAFESVRSGNYDIDLLPLSREIVEAVRREREKGENSNPSVES